MNNKEKECDICGKDGHTGDECPEASLEKVYNDDDSDESE